MKKYFAMFAGILITALFFTGCDSYAQTGNGNYGYSGYGYGDGQPGSDYYYNSNQQPGGQAPVGFNDFYNQLSPYGYWVNIAPYGLVWIANVPNFQPYYTNGYWSYTTYGWTWVSNYAWGWAPFHYGRWSFSNSYGWYWVPGYAWGPAWVAWSSSSDMYGWAPLLPGMDFSVSLSLNAFPSSFWTFVSGKYMGASNIGNYYVNRTSNVTIIKKTTIVNNYGTENNRRYSMGPQAVEVQRYTGKTIQPMRVTTLTENKGGGISNNELRIYRPSTIVAPQASNNRPNGNTPGRSSGPQAKPQPNQPGNKQAAPQSKTPAPQQRAYQPNPAQPKVGNVGPQTSKQIQAAQNENKRIQQQPTRR